MEIVISGVKPYDGSYEFPLVDEMTTREWGYIKRLTGYLPLTLEEAIEGGDPEFGCILAAIALRRAGKVEAREMAEVFERLIDAPFGSTVTIEVEDEEKALEGDDAGPPAPSSSANGSSSGPDSRTSSEELTETLPASGTPDSGTSASELPTWET